MKRYQGLAILAVAMVAIYYFFLRSKPLFVTQQGFTGGTGGLDDYLRDQATSATVTAPAPDGPEVYIASLDDHFLEEEF